MSSVKEKVNKAGGPLLTRAIGFFYKLKKSGLDNKAIPAVIVLRATLIGSDNSP